MYRRRLLALAVSVAALAATAAPAGAAASLIEGAWLNQCLTAPDETFLPRAGRLLWDGATTARS